MTHSSSRHHIPEDCHAKRLPPLAASFIAVSGKCPSGRKITDHVDRTSVALKAGPYRETTSSNPAILLAVGIPARIVSAVGRNRPFVVGSRKAEKMQGKLAITFEIIGVRIAAAC